MACLSDVVAGWGHPRAAEWVAARVGEGRVRGVGDLLRELVRDEIDKLYNQAWCALERLEEAEDDDESMMMVAIDELPSAVEQAAALDPEIAGEILELLRRHRPERYENIVAELGLGTDRETAERIECLAFWEENAEDTSPLRKTLFRLVREELEGREAG